MKKFINNVDDFLKESLNGFGKAHSDIIRVNFEPNFISRKTKTKEGKVSLISGGGSGHEPMHGGFVGHGMLDAAAQDLFFRHHLQIKCKQQQNMLIVEQEFYLS